MFSQSVLNSGAKAAEYAIASLNEIKRFGGSVSTTGAGGPDADSTIIGGHVTDTTLLVLGVAAAVLITACCCYRRCRDGNNDAGNFHALEEGRAGPHR